MSKIEYELKYDLYLAEKEYYSQIDKLMQDMILKEEVTYGYINEGMKEAVTNYIANVTNSAQKAWNKFKKKVDRARDLNNLKKMRKSVLTFKDGDFYINNYPQYNIDALKNLQIIPMNYNQMRDNLKSREAFMNEYYKAVNYGKKESVKKAVKNYLTSNVLPRFQVTKQFLVDKFNFNTRDYFELITAVEEDMNALNKSNEGIISLSGSIAPTQESIDFRSVYEGLLLEALPTAPKNNPIKPDKSPITSNMMKKSDNKMSFTDTNGNRLTPRRKLLSSDSYLKKINVYMECMTGIVSAKMTVLDDEYNNNMSIITMVYNRSGGGVMVTDRSGKAQTSIEI